MAFDLNRFVLAQESVYKTVCEELAAGRKTTHWIWFIFPQLKALGRSPTAKFFGIEGIEEARAYWAHPLLRSRLLQCARLVLEVRGRTIHQILGSPDDMKLCSCATLFSEAAPQDTAMKEILERYYEGIPDNTTLTLLKSQRP
ncbi:uncharacterized protein (DUF1810 family) [Variovorax boronicumulans]|uniref:DUF1810 domain-containing protein n=1 Tax=Variovorax boronicumulans TaxID=436515 RepID=UPI002475AA84|nr:DUF1810 domain-containing protein [Variovorax boronicumulans]MDH6170039.1 uncharacterized protein (DUF1810 family) [Variovorax boronicumulans]